MEGHVSKHGNEYFNRLLEVCCSWCLEHATYLQGSHSGVRGIITANDNLLFLVGSPQKHSVDRKGPSHVIVMSLLSQFSIRKIQKWPYKAAARSHGRIFISHSA